MNKQKFWAEIIIYVLKKSIVISLKFIIFITWRELFSYADGQLSNIYMDLYHHQAMHVKQCRFANS